MKNLLPFILFLLANLQFFGQAGPGGVSQETTGNSNLKIWLDAGEISASDNTAISAWTDISLSAINNTPTQSTGASQPIFRNNISAGINGQPVVRFAGNKYFSFASSADINQNGPYTERSTFLVFKTGTDITTRQILFEQGGNVRGLNIFIANDTLYLGGYDFQNDGDGTPSWGFTAAKQEIQTNTTYVVSHLLNGSLGATTGTITGYLNGQLFPINATGVGSLWTHPDAPGLGAQTASTVMENGISSGTGSNPFLGDFAEFISYESLVNDAQRIIIENYLGAKYSANAITNDKYAHQLNYGSEVIGIGRESGASNMQNISKARNLFEIKADTAQFSDGDYFLVGHNNGDATTYTTTGAPNLGVFTQRLAREWKVDHTGNLDSITFTVDISDLPTPSSGYNYYYIAIDKSGGLTGDFNSAQTEVIQLVQTSGNLHQATAIVPDNAFITLGVLSAEVTFENSSFQKFETDLTFTDSIKANLNFIPSQSLQVDYSVSDNSAIQGSDMNNFTPNQTLVFNKNAKEAYLKFDIIGDVSPEPVKDFSISLNNGGNTSIGLNLGTPSTATIQINDNDNPPKLRFKLLSASFNENAGSVNIEVVRRASLIQACSVSARLRQVGGSGTATLNTDYSFTSTVINFASNDTTETISLSLTNDQIDESNETIILELFDAVDADIVQSANEYELTILDDDNAPTIEFVTASSQGPESNGSPSIPIKLSAPSAQIASVDYTITGASTATNAIDYTAATSGIINFPAGDTVVYFPITVVADGISESDETVVITLSNGGNLANATLGGNLTFTYTIQDYVEFEFQGVGGVGTAADNIIWFDANALTGSHNSTISNLTDQSSNGNNGTQGTGANQALLQTSSNLINNKKVLRFDGANDFYQIANAGNINSNGPYSAKHFFTVIKTGANVSSSQLIYEQGGTTNGISLYISGGQLIFHPYNTGGGTPWGGTGGNSLNVTGGSLSPNTTYLVSAVYNANATNQIEVFLNGTSIGTVTAGVGNLEDHTGDINIGGGPAGSTNFTTGSNPASFFGGDIAEFIKFTDAPISTVRQRIIENSLAGKYNLSIANNYYSYSNTHSNNIIGIGKTTGSDYHLKSKGAGVLTLQNPSDVDNNEFTFVGHNDSAMVWSTQNTPTSYTANSGERLQRVWRIDETGNLGTYTLVFDLTGVTNGNEADYELLIDTDGDFSNATVHTTGLSFNGATTELTFTNVDLSNGDYFTLGTVIDDIVTVQNGNWGTPSTWNCNCVPSGANQVFIDHSVSIASNQSAGNITVNGGGSLNFSNAVTLSISGDLTLTGSITPGNGGLTFNGTEAQTITSATDYDLNNLILDNPNGLTIGGSNPVDLTGTITIDQGTLSTNNNLTLISTASKSARIYKVNSGNITGNVTIQNYKEAIQGWRYLTSTVAGQTLQDWTDDIYTTGFPGSDVPSNSFVSITTYDEDSLGDAGAGYRNATDITNPIEQGRGYIVYTLGGKTVDVTGTPYQGNISLPVSYTDDPGQAISQDGWNLVANPYACPVDWQSASWIKTNLSDEIHIWDPQIENYFSFVGGVGTNGGNRYIPAGMAFFVKANGGGVPVLTVTEDTKVDLGIPFIKSQPSYKLLRISGTFNTSADEIVIKDDDQSTLQYEDGSDAFKLNTFSTEKSYIATFSDEEDELAINAYNVNPDSFYLPLRLNVDSLHFLNSIDPNQVYYLVNELNEVIAILDKREKSFAFTEGLTGMFVLMNAKLYEESEPIHVEEIVPEDIKIIHKGGFVEINGRYPISTIEVYDVSGKLILIEQPNNHWVKIDGRQFPPISLIKIKDHNHNKLVKKLVGFGL